MRKINRKSIKEKWFVMEEDAEVKLLMRPFPTSQYIIASTMSGDAAEMANINWILFKYCIMDWKGFIDDNDKPLKCNDDNKKLIFDYDRDVVLFAVEKIAEFNVGIVEEKKTLQK